MGRNITSKARPGIGLALLQAEANKERFKKDKEEYLTENLDHARWSSRLDEELFAQFLEFYNKAIK